MPRMQVYLPDDLYREVKARALPASELLQAAVRAEVRRLDLLAAGRAHAEALAADVGEPASAEQERADLIARRLVRRPFHGAGRPGPSGR
jgi:post-segregation antitoxin (ccd killing protein)